MRHPRITYAAQGVAALILIAAAGMKFVGNPSAVEVFVHLDMEPGGRIIIAIVELITALLLLSPNAALGSVLAVAVMLGAIIAHVTELGLVVNDDGGQLFGMLILVLICSIYVLISRRKEIPIIGQTF